MLLMAETSFVKFFIDCSYVKCQLVLPKNNKFKQ